MPSRTRSLVLMFGVVGLGFAGASAWVHHALLTDPTYTSFCDVNATFNCSQVYLSEYGSFQGISTALGGLIWFGLAVLLAAFGGQPTPAPSSGETKGKSKAKVPVSPVGAYLFAWSTIGLAVILYLGYASFFVLGTACLLCMGTYVCVIGIFVLSGSTSSIPFSEIPGRLADDVSGLFGNPSKLAAAVLFLVAVGSSLAFFPRDTRARTAEEALAQANASAPPVDQQTAWLAEWDKAPREETGVPADGAKVLIVKFNDFQCPACREGFVWFKPVIEEFERTNPGEVKFVIKAFPLEGECNFATPNMNHYSACEAAAAHYLAREVNKADEMEAWLFTNQTRLATTGTVQDGYKTVTGLDNFTDDYARALEAIRQDVSDAVALKISSTPTYFVNGVRLQGNLQIPYFKLAIEHELKKADGQ